MHIAYCDESADGSRTISSAIVVPDSAWRDAFAVIRDFRQSLKRRYGIPLEWELHSRDLVGGKGMPGKWTHPIGRRLGAEIFFEAISTIDSLGQLGVYGINVSMLNAGLRHPLRSTTMRLFQRFENNLNKLATPEFGLIVYDGQERQSKTMAHRLLRRMQIYNPVPSLYGGYRNIPVTRILGDPMIRNSADDVFIQMADVMAYALLRQDNPPTHPITAAMGLVIAFDHLGSIWHRPAAAKDRQGVVRE